MSHGGDLIEGDREPLRADGKGFARCGSCVQTPKELQTAKKMILHGGCLGGERTYRKSYGLVI